MRTRTVLVVDDDDVIREVSKVALEIVGGWRVLVAENGPQAQEVARTRQPDAILLDVMMPGMDGLRTASALRGDPDTRQIPVVFLTAKASDPDTLNKPKGNSVGVIAKPFDPMTLAAEIAELLGWTE